MWFATLLTSLLCCGLGASSTAVFFRRRFSYTKADAAAQCRDQPQLRREQRATHTAASASRSLSRIHTGTHLEMAAQPHDALRLARAGHGLKRVAESRAEKALERGGKRGRRERETIEKGHTGGHCPNVALHSLQERQ